MCEKHAFILYYCMHVRNYVLGSWPQFKQVFATKTITSVSINQPMRSYATSMLQLYLGMFYLLYCFQSVSFASK